MRLTPSVSDIRRAMRSSLLRYGQRPRCRRTDCGQSMKTCVAERALRHNLPCRANVSTTLVGDGMDITRDMSGPTKQVVVRHLLAGPLVRAKLLFLFASFVSPILSVSLCFSGHQLQDLFVGIWSHLSWRRERWSSAVTSADHEPNPVVQHRGRASWPSRSSPP